MATDSLQDKRLIERAARKGDLAQVKQDALAAEAPDMAGAVRELAAEEIDALSEELEREQTLRAERIQRFIEEGPPAEPKPEIIPMSETEF